MKVVLRISLAIALLAVLVIGAAVAFTFTDAFKRLVRDQIARAATGAIRGEVSIGRIEGSVWGGATIHGLRLTFGGETLVAVPRLSLRYELLSILSGTLDVTEVRLVHPSIRLGRDAEGRWNLLQAVASAVQERGPAPQPSGGLPIGIGVPSIELSGGSVEIALAGEPPRLYRVSDLFLDAGADLRGTEVDAELRRLTASLTTEGAPPLEVEIAGATYGTDAAIGVERAAFETPASKVTLSAEVTDLDTLRTEAELGIERIAAEELRRWLPSLPLEADLSGTAAIEGTRADLDVRLALRAAGAELRAGGNADLSGAEPSYRARLELSAADLERLLTLKQAGGIVAADLRLSGTGTQARSATVEGSMRVERLRVGTAALGDATASVELRGGQARSEGRLTGPQGSVTWNGGLAIDERRYKAEIRTEALDLAGIAPDAARLEGRIDLTAKVDGRGFAPTEMDTRVDVDLRPSRVGPVEVSGGALQARVSDGRVDVRDLTLSASGADLTASGGIGLTPGAEGEIDYALRVPDAAPWLGLVGQSGGGSLRLTGTAHGALGALATEGSLEIEGLRVAASRVESASLEFDLAGIGDGWPHGSARASLRGVQAGQPIDAVTANVLIEDREPPLARVDAEATMWQDHTQRVRAEVELGARRTAARLEELRVDVPVGVWELAQPALVVREDDRLFVDGLRLANGAQTLSVDGAIGAAPGSRLEVVARDFQLGVAEPFVGRVAREISGTLNADLVVAGTLSDPRPSGTIALSDGQAHVVPLDVTIREATLDADLAPGRIAVTRVAARAREGRLSGSGSVVLRGGRPDALALDLRADRWPAIHTQRYKAEITANLHAEGPLTGPTVEGRVDVLEADLRPDFALLQQNEPPPRDRTIVIVGSEEPQPTAEDPQAAPAGDLVKNLALDVTVAIQRNTWIKRDQSALELSGEVRVEKTAADPDPAVTGSVQVERGWIYLYGRRFEAERGVITFTGGREIDPSLDIVLRSRVGEYEIRTIVHGTAEKPALDFESTPRLDDADVLAVLMFGKPVSQLGQGEQVALQEQAANLAAGYVAGRLVRAVGDVFGLQISEIDVAERRVGVGRYVTPKTYVSVNQQIGAEAGREVRIEYYLSPHWTVQTEADSEGESGIDIFWRREY